jgi:fucokinase
MRSITHSGFVSWDFVILTASNERQAAGFLAQIEERQKAGLLPSSTQFGVVPDEDGKRVGSGGATLSVIKYIIEKTGSHSFEGLRILVIHSGGDSKRVPQYSALGKLFSPVPHELPDGRSSTLFDEFIIAMSSVPGRIREGMVLLSGDVLLLFNPLQIDFSGEGAAAISFKENVETGKNHGVFLKGKSGNVARFLHKQSVESLKKYGAVNESGNVDIDTGAVIFSSDMLSSLASLISENGRISYRLYKKFVNDKVRLSLYGDFLYPLAEKSTLENFYYEKPEGEFCEELRSAREAVWNTLRPYRMKLLRLAPAKFIHFGTTKEILSLMSTGIYAYKDLKWSRNVGSSIDDKIAGYNSVCSTKANVGDNCYLETSYVHGNASVGNGSLLSYVDVHDENIPDNVVLHGLKLQNGKFVARIYGVSDNPKDSLDLATFFGKPFKEFLIVNRISENEIWTGSSKTLWEARLYPACDTIDEAVSAAVNLYNLACGTGNIDAWRNAERKSLQSGFNEADPKAIIGWNKRMSELVQMDRIAKIINAGQPAEMIKDILSKEKLTSVQRTWLEKHLKTADFSEKIRLFYYIGIALGGKNGEEYVAKCFETIGKSVLDNAIELLKTNDECKIVKENHTVRLPLRVNWGGGWSDTPPYCNENGGTVLNAAILLNGEMPVEVRLQKISEKKIIFDSRDMDVHGEFDDIEALQKTGDPYDPFALQKAALLATGIIPIKGGNLDEILTRLGGGFIMNSEVRGVPKGSGLGTSSILAAACVKAVFEFMGIDFTEDVLYDKVLSMEQIMSTGGGWQDQVGGLLPGVKFITAMPGIHQEIKVQKVHIPEEIKKELNERFVLIYTGQRRLARNLLRDVVGRYVGAQPDSIYALNEIQRVAALMKFELERGRLDNFINLLNSHWELSKMVDEGSSNTLIDQIFESVEDLIDGKMICGAGGGGFLQVILKENVSKDSLRNRLKAVFQDSDVDVWECTLI